MQHSGGRRYDYLRSYQLSHMEELRIYKREWARKKRQKKMPLLLKKKIFTPNKYKLLHPPKRTELEEKFYKVFGKYPTERDISKFKPQLYYPS